MNFYQSELRYHINRHIYDKPVFHTHFLGKEYFGISKIQRKFGKTFRRYMIHGVELGDVTYFNQEIKDTLGQIVRDYNKGFGDIFFQLGCADVFDARATSKVKKLETQEELKQKRDYIRSDMRQWYDLKPSWREHMPDATIVLDLKKTPTEMFKGMSDSGKRYINKGKKAHLGFEIASTKNHWNKFREMRYATAYDKGFHIPSQEDFIALMEYLEETKQGKLFLAKKGRQLVSGSLCLFYGKQMIYLYGATDRSFGSIGGHYWLTHEIAKWGHAHDISKFDLLGVATPGYEKGHYLQGVTRFKQSFGGRTESSIGNFDLVFNKLLYTTYKKWKKVR